MVNNNKILTVSYGTFSCTLEGFEDSFETMKAIAEYFRDLAADDRYFGAEPPQLDPETLALIARREASRSVEARRDANGTGVILRANAYEAPAETPAEQPAPAAAAPVEPVAEAPAPEVEVAVAETAEPVAPVSPAAQSFAPESIAAKLQRIRAVVSRNEAAEADDYSEDEHADSVIASAADEMTAALDADSQHVDADEPEALPVDDELSAAFARIDARAETAIYAGDQGSYEEETDATDGNVMSILAAMQAEATTAAEAEEVEAADEANTLATADDEAADDEDADVLFADAPEDMATEELSDEDEDDDEEEDDEEVINILDQSTGDATPMTMRVKRADLEAAIAAGELEEVVEDHFAALAEQKRAERAAEEARELAAKEAAEAAARAVMDEDESSLSPEDEADLMAELAQIEAEHAEDLPEVAETVEETIEAADETIEAASDAEEIAALRPAEEEETAAEVEAVEDETPETPESPARLVADQSDSDVSRLMAAAEARMGEAESSTSRETYRHLRAAVAATEAERSAGRNPGDASGDDVYREDLANVVRPRRPRPNGTARPERPSGESRPAPLKLVAEQRVDLDQDTARGPVRPRRVSAPEAEAGESGGFEKYAADMGATELRELLEAAASYLSFVEGREQFSRPQLMNKVRQVQHNEFNREDGLRSFGQLLREGKIEKTGGGRFTATHDIGFRPDARAAG